MSALSDQTEIGIVCTCGFKRRATKISATDTRYNGHEVEAMHWFEIAQKRQVSFPFAPVNPADDAHTMTVGLFATMEWSAVTEEEQKIGEAWLAGFKSGAGQARALMTARLAKVTSGDPL